MQVAKLEQLLSGITADTNADTILPCDIPSRPIASFSNDHVDNDLGCGHRIDNDFGFERIGNDCGLKHDGNSVCGISWRMAYTGGTVRRAKRNRVGVSS